MCLYNRTENKLIRAQLESLYYINRGPYKYCTIVYFIFVSCVLGIVYV